MIKFIAQYELYELDQAHLNKFEAEITSAVTFLDVIEVIKKMVDVLFAHINNLTKDLYEFSHYDQKELESNKAKYYENLEKEIKIQEKLRREQVKELVQSDKDKKTLLEELEILKNQNQVVTKSNHKKLSEENRNLQDYVRNLTVRPSRSPTAQGSRSPKPRSPKSVIPVVFGMQGTPKMSEQIIYSKPSKKKPFLYDPNLEINSNVDREPLLRPRRTTSGIPRGDGSAGVLGRDKQGTDTHTPVKSPKAAETPMLAKGSKGSLMSYLLGKNLDGNGSPPPGSPLNLKKGAQRSRSQKALSFMTINNISMQNLINKNVSSYQMVMNKSVFPYAAGARCGTSYTGDDGSMPSSAGGAPGHSTSQPFQKKLKKYINKRASVLGKKGPPNLG